VIARLLVVAVAAAALLAGVARAAPPATMAPGQLTVGLSMPSEGFQVGVVKGSEVIYARGLEIDLARELARRLQLRGVTFVQNAFTKLLTPGPKPWDIALAEVTITSARAENVDFSIPYMKVDQGVLLSQFVRSVPKSIAALRGLRLCAESGTTGAETIAKRIRPTRAPRLIADVPTLMLGLQNGHCDAVVYDLPALATLKARASRRYGPLAGLIRTGERYGAVLPKGSALLKPVNRAIRAILEDGAVTRMQRAWLAVDLSKVRTLS
jgi:polar amino acid transport system substrate-binding protein